MSIFERIFYRQHMRKLEFALGLWAEAVDITDNIKHLRGV